MVLILLSCIKAINIDYYWNFYIHLLKNLSQIYEKHSWWKLTCWEVFQYFSHVKKIQYFKTKLENLHNIYIMFFKLNEYKGCVTWKNFENWGISLKNIEGLREIFKEDNFKKY